MLISNWLRWNRSRLEMAELYVPFELFPVNLAIVTLGNELTDEAWRVNKNHLIKLNCPIQLCVFIASLPTRYI